MENTRYFESFSAARKAIEEFEIETNTQFAIVKKTKNFAKEWFPESTDHLRVWCSGRTKLLPADETQPYLIVGHVIKQCVHGPSSKKKDNAQKLEEKEVDHVYARSLTRSRKQPTKKLGCKSVMRIQEILCFSEFTVTSQRQRKNASRIIKDAISTSSLSNLPSVRKFVVLFPDASSHQNHITGEASGLNKTLDRKIINKIHEIVHSGVHTTTDIKRSVHKYADTLQPPQASGCKLNRRLYPLHKDVYNHTQLAMSDNRYSRKEQENVEELMKELGANDDSSVAFFRPHSNEKNEKLLLVLQLGWQKHLMSRYGASFAIDSTFGTTKYDLPLYQVVVQTNSLHAPVAMIITEDERADSLGEALELLRSHNTDWNPNVVMVDIDAAESKALSQVFSDASIQYCKFHREQAWDRWLSRDDNGLRAQKNNVLHLLRAISNSLTAEQFEDTVARLKSSTVWEEMSNLRKYIGNFWLNVPERWVLAFRPLDETITLTTTNGVERLHGELKSQLGREKNRSLHGLLTVMLEDFLPEIIRRYLQRNICQSSQSKAYCDQLPGFLHNRPSRFIDHCQQRLHDAAQLTVVTKDNECFIVSSASSDVQYRICTDDVTKLCSCHDFKKHFMPCKHMLAVALKSEEGWQSFPRRYRESVYYTLDGFFPQKQSKRDVVMTTGVSETDGHKTPSPCHYDVIMERPPTPRRETLTLRTKILEKLKIIKNYVFQLTSQESLDTISNKLDELTDVMTTEVTEQKFRRTSTNSRKRKGSPLPLKKRKRNKPLKQSVHARSLDNEASNAERVGGVIRDLGQFEIPRTDDVSLMFDCSPPTDLTVKPESLATIWTSLTPQKKDKASDVTDLTSSTLLSDECPPKDLTPKPATPAKSGTKVGGVIRDLGQFEIPRTDDVSLMFDCSPPTDLTVKPESLATIWTSLTPQKKDKASDVTDLTSSTLLSDECPPKDLTPKPATPAKSGTKKSPVPELTTAPSLNDSSPKEKPHIPSIKDIWKFHPQSDVLMAIVGGNKLYGSSFGSIRDGMEVRDEIITAYMDVVCRKHEDTRRIMQINCHVMTSIIRKPREASLMKKVHFDDFDIVLAPFNESRHWELCVILPKKRTVIYLNPLGEQEEKVQRLSQSWLSFINRRFIAGLESAGPYKTWSVKTIDHPRQQDNVSCGVFIMKGDFHETTETCYVVISKMNIFHKLRDEVCSVTAYTTNDVATWSADTAYADMLAAGKEDLTFSNTKLSVKRYRELMSQEILKYCESSVEKHCRQCAMMHIDSCKDWVQCDSCNWWYHIKCADPAGTILIECGLSGTYLCDCCLLPHGEPPVTSTPAKEKTCPAFPVSPIVPKPRTKENTKVHTPPNVKPEPFILTHLTNRIKVCQGCKQLFKKPVEAPDNLVLKHYESYTFFNQNVGSQMTKWGNRFYHLAANCVKAKFPKSAIEDICIPPNIILTDQHITHSNSFGIPLQKLRNTTLL